MHGKMIEARVRELAPGRKTTAKFMGWRPDLPDHQDYKFTEMLMTVRQMKAGMPVRAVDSRIFKQPVNDQDETGSCTGQSTSVLHAIERNVTPRSALFTYWHARDLIGETARDDGAFVRDAIKSTNVEGVPRDDLWPMDKKIVLKEPSAKAETDAEKRKIFNYYRLDADPDVKVDRGQVYRTCLASGHCFVIGFTVYESFWDAGYNGGIASMPQGLTDGGHAVIVYGYDDDFQNSDIGKAAAQHGANVPSSVYMVRNSWSRDWGHNGDFFIPAAYFEDPNLADDAWTIRRK
jgi:C1A family cysteine protease